MSCARMSSACCHFLMATLDGRRLRALLDQAVERRVAVAVGIQRTVGAVQRAEVVLHQREIHVPGEADQAHRLLLLDLRQQVGDLRLALAGAVDAQRGLDLTAHRVDPGLVAAVDVVRDLDGRPGRRPRRTAAWPWPGRRRSSRRRSPRGSPPRPATRRKSPASATRGRSGRSSPCGRSPWRGPAGRRGWRTPSGTSGRRRTGRSSSGSAAGDRPGQPGRRRGARAESAACTSTLPLTRSAYCGLLVLVDLPGDPVDLGGPCP